MKDRVEVRHAAGLVSAAVLLFAAVASAGEVTVKMDAAHPNAWELSKTLYGIFFEDINSSADGGIYPELVKNRGFDQEVGCGPGDEQACTRSGGESHMEGWTIDNRDGMARLSVEYGRPVNEASAAHLRIAVFAPGREGAGVRNDGYFGIYVETGKKYDLSFYARGLDGYAGGLRVLLEDREGRVLAEYKVANAEMSVSARDAESFAPALPGWKRYAAVLEPAATTSEAHLSVLATGRGMVEVEQVSLFPQDTFNGRKNGLRRDLVEMLRDLHPGVLRFPGGCVVEGSSYGDWYDWKRSVGDGTLESRHTMWNRWGYNQTLGLGYYEYFQLAEDIGAEPLPIMGCGVTCQFKDPWFVIPMDGMDGIVDSLCDLVEFANGDAKATKWGALRAKMGHPAPFNMHYLGIGNENWDGKDRDGRWDGTFTERFKYVAAKFHERHPEIRIVSSAGPSPDDDRCRHAWEVLSVADHADLVDEHYYVSPDWLLTRYGRYDGYDRKGPKVYAGEYACHLREDREKKLPARRNNLYAALCEAAFMTGFDRNSDVIEMTSYAPLFARLGHNQWSPDMIWFDESSVWATPSYYVQQMYMTKKPRHTVPVVMAEPGKPDCVAVDRKYYATAGVTDGRLVVKVVNVTDAPVSFRLEFGRDLPKGKAVATELAGSPEDGDVNERRTVVKPSVRDFEFAGGAKDAFAAKPWSFTVLEYPL